MPGISLSAHENSTECDKVTTFLAGVKENAEKSSFSLAYAHVRFFVTSHRGSLASPFFFSHCLAWCLYDDCTVFPFFFPLRDGEAPPVECGKDQNWLRDKEERYLFKCDYVYGLTIDISWCAKCRIYGKRKRTERMQEEVCIWLPNVYEHLKWSPISWDLNKCICHKKNNNCFFVELVDEQHISFQIKTSRGSIAVQEKNRWLEKFLLTGRLTPLGFPDQIREERERKII